MRGWLCLVLLLSTGFLSSASRGAAPPARPSVFLNGVNIDGVTSQKFENCTVIIDDKGNVLIVAKGYAVQTQSPPPPPPPVVVVRPEPVSKRYFLVGETNPPGAQYDVDVFINAIWVGKVSETDRQTIIEITKHLHKGENKIQLAATKKLKDGRKSSAPGHWLKIHVGEGVAEGPSVTLESPAIEYVRTAAEDKDLAEEFTLVGR